MSPEIQIVLQQLSDVSKKFDDFNGDMREFRKALSTMSEALVETQTMLRDYNGLRERLSEVEEFVTAQKAIGTSKSKRLTQISAFGLFVVTTVNTLFFVNDHMHWW